MTYRHTLSETCLMFQSKQHKEPKNVGKSGFCNIWYVYIVELILKNNGKDSIDDVLFKADRKFERLQKENSNAYTDFIFMYANEHDRARRLLKGYMESNDISNVITLFDDIIHEQYK